MNPEAIAVGAGQGVGTGVGFWAAFKFIRWLAEFITGRLDRRSDRLEQRERALEDRFNAELLSVRLELARYREATMRLVSALAERDPTNKTLRDVGRILSAAIPVEPDKDSDLVTQLDEIPGKA